VIGKEEQINSETEEFETDPDVWKDAFDAAELFEEKNKKEESESDESENSIDEPEYEEVEYEESEPEVETPKNNPVFDKSLLKENEHLKEKLENKEIQFKRLAADFDNYRRRQDIEKEDLLKYGNEKIILEVVSVIDNFERAIESAKNASDISAVVSGIEMIHKQLSESLKRQGLAVIESLDQPFDPNFHEAVQQMVNNDKPDQTVLYEVGKGYTLNGRVIRPSMVVVSTVSEE